MSNLHDIRRKKTPIILADKTYHLHYDLNAFAELEELYGSVETAMNKLCEGSVKAIISVLWAGLLHEDETLTPKDIGKMFDLSQVQEIGELINKAISEAIPQNE